jgi:GAF domain-containing protein
VEVRSLIAAPLVAQGAVLGTLLLTWRERLGVPDETDADYASKVAALVALALSAVHH